MMGAGAVGLFLVSAFLLLGRVPVWYGVSSMRSTGLFPALFWCGEGSTEAYGYRGKKYD